MNVQITQGIEKVTFPTGAFISPGFHSFHTRRIDIHETWVWGEIVDTKEEVVDTIHDIDVEDPGMDGEDENAWPLRGLFSLLNKTWTVVRDDDIGFWGFRGCEPKTKSEWFAEVEASNRAGIEAGAGAGWWDIGPHG